MITGLRFKVVLSFTFLFFLLIIARLFYWQIVKGDEFVSIAQGQYTSVVKVPPARGEIRSFDNFPLLSNRRVFLVFVSPKDVEDKKQVSLALSSLLEMEEATVSALLHHDLVWVPIKHNVEREVKEKIENLKIKGVGFEEESLRFYPEASMAAHLLGFVGKDEGGSEKGYFGLEGYYDRELKGREGKTFQVKDTFGWPILLAPRREELKIDGKHFLLHLDRRIQFIAEEKLREGVKRYGAKGGSVAIMDPKTGAILALASLPSYEGGKYQEFDEAFYKDPILSDTYEPGSTFKVLVMAGALNDEVVIPDSRCDACGGPIRIGEYTIKNWNDKYYQGTSMIEVIEHSDNTGMVYVTRKLGLEKLFSYLQKFGIGASTGIDLQGEVNPGLRVPNKWYPIDLATASFGQGIAVTPIQMLTAVAVLANGGKLMEPHVVSKIIDERGKEVAIKPKVIREIISQNTAKVVTEMMVNSVEQGEAKWTKIPGYRVAGKTGTSQIAIAGHYDPDRTVASFVGFAPAEDPRFAMLVKVNEPKTSFYGSETAAPIFFKIAKEILLYYGIPPR